MKSPGQLIVVGANAFVGLILLLGALYAVNETEQVIITHF